MTFSPVNPALSALGCPPEARVVIFHADDLGMGEATVSAYAELEGRGALTSASVMLPCTWAPGAAREVKARPEADVGVHLTLTSEWDACRWAPLSGPVAGLVDEEGYFHRRTEEARQAPPEAVARELRAQLERALAWGLDVTHMDAHMGAAAWPPFFPALAELALGYGVPFFYLRHDAAGWEALGFGPREAERAAQFGLQLEERGFPLVDHLRTLPLDVGGDHAALTLQMARELPPGITHFILHPAKDTPELRAVAHDWEARVANFEAFRSPELRAALEAEGVQLSGYRPLRDLFRRRLGGGA